MRIVLAVGFTFLPSERSPRHASAGSALLLDCAEWNNAGILAALFQPVLMRRQVTRIRNYYGFLHGTGH